MIDESVDENTRLVDITHSEFFFFWFCSTERGKLPGGVVGSEAARQRGPLCGGVCWDRRVRTDCSRLHSVSAFSTVFSDRHSGLGFGPRVGGLWAYVVSVVLLC